MIVSSIGKFHYIESHGGIFVVQQAQLMHTSSSERSFVEQSHIAVRLLCTGLRLLYDASITVCNGAMVWDYCGKT